MCSYIEPNSKTKEYAILFKTLLKNRDFGKSILIFSASIDFRLEKYYNRKIQN
ncbi:hypothetical protein LEP1GSC188_0144 [Leptospira weilii serovar Topaz str. LT2116]|uniref:Uncharacterized protein n=2 Tax=Leptospira weilii TaxID=28184 RepID=M3H1L8_9LEPT|nr:hypothetical protein LEP1GSC188_0144 [Leptospira weilii serovar Topaz str. LT2116]EMN42938.1 hypothetical protein LEP1GSC086_1777 [Leptospira weilii str. LNT 1234]EMY12042.1 hypothetical protein LEP1GSC043_4313 [Leptospira weilii str. Ecochallenge]